MRISDWSSDVCSSDLDITVDAIAAALGVAVEIHPEARAMLLAYYETRGGLTEARLRMARAPDRKSTRLTPVTNAHIVCRLLLAKKKTNIQTTNSDTYP